MSANKVQVSTDSLAFLVLAKHGFMVEILFFVVCCLQMYDRKVILLGAGGTTIVTPTGICIETMTTGPPGKRTPTVQTLPCLLN